MRKRGRRYLSQSNDIRFPQIQNCVQIVQENEIIQRRNRLRNNRQNSLQNLTKIKIRRDNRKKHKAFCIVQEINGSNVFTYRTEACKMLGQCICKRKFSNKKKIKEEKKFNIRQNPRSFSFQINEYQPIISDKLKDVMLPYRKRKVFSYSQRKLSNTMRQEILSERMQKIK